MKMKAIAVSLFALTLGVGSVAQAGSTNYYPPERISCKINALNKASCNGFDHQYLVEDAYTANLTSKDEALTFVSGVAYYTPQKDEASVFFTYRDNHLKTVKLKTTRTSMRPDLENGGWRKFNEDIYNCDSGYMSCPITDLPEHSRKK